MYYVNSPAGLLGVQVVKSVATGGGTVDTTEMRYYHRDHLGSITSITNEAGAKLEALAYEAFGERRNANGDMEDRTSPILGITTDRGYTGHEHLDELNLIHMNGRIYDPVLGRFMTPDPHIQHPNNLQDYNRYSYCLNSPVGCTDPSGYFSLGKAFRVAAIVVISYYTGGAAAGWYASAAGVAATSTTALIVGGAAGGFTAGFLSSGGDFNAGLQGAFTGAVFAGIGAAANANGWGMAEKVGAHAVGGCITASAGGGSCAQGAISAAVGKAATGFLTDAGSWGDNNLNDFTRGVAVAAAGGVGSMLAGGKFDDGARTAAYGYLFNYCSSATVGCFKAWGQALVNLGFGGLGVASGVGLCGTLAGCIAGAPMTVLSTGKFAEAIDWIRGGDEATDGRNIVRETSTAVLTAAGATPTSARVAYGFAEISSGALALRAPVSLAEKLWTPYGIQSTGGLGLTVQAIQTKPFRALAVGGVAAGGAATIYGAAK